MAEPGLDRVVKMAEMRLITGLSRHLVLKLVEQGMPVQQNPKNRQDDYLFNLADCLRWHVDRGKGSASAVVDEDGQALDFNVERARLTKEQADKTAFENAENRKRLVDRHRLEAGLAAQDLALKDRLMTVPMAAAPEAVDAAREGGLSAAADVIAKHISSALSDVASAEVVARVAA